MDDRVGERLTGPRDVEGGAVVDRGAYDRESEGHIHAGVEGEELHRSVTLVVVHANDRVITPTVHGLEEHGVGRMRARHVEPFVDGGFNGRGDAVDVFVAEQAVFAGVGVEAAHRDAGTDEESTEDTVRKVDHVGDPLGLNPHDRLAKGAVRAHVGDGQRPGTLRSGQLGGQHHRHR